MDSLINILCATDDKYAPYCGVMLTSLFENNKNNDINVFVFVGGPLRRTNQRRFAKLEKQYRRQINFITIDDTIIRNYPIRTSDRLSRLTLATYYRLLTADYLPESIDRVLYLDCDIIVMGDLSSLWNTDLCNKAVFAISDRLVFSVEQPQSRLNYPSDAGYFNAGVLLINLDYWRTNSIRKRSLDYLSTNYDRLLYYDQDVLNAVLWDKSGRLPLDYNFQINFLSKKFLDSVSDSDRGHILRVAEHRPIIIHYISDIKPWSILYYSMPFARVWMRYKKRSPWSGTLPTIPKRKKINWLIKRFVLWPLGIKTIDDYMCPVKVPDGL